MSVFDLKKPVFMWSKSQEPFQMKVSGSSMYPILNDGDTITICLKKDYKIGDILVFQYKNDAILVHRLLKIQNGRFFCKGDNSFRMEDVEKDKIVGYVLIDHDPHNTEDFIIDSIRINRIFHKLGFDVESTKKSAEYKIFQAKYLDTIQIVY